MIPALVPSPRSALVPLHVGVLRALAEASVGCATLLLAGVIAYSFDGLAGASLTALFNTLAWVGLMCWPAWRLRRVRMGNRWMRVARGILRGVLMSLLLGIAASLLALLLWGHPLD